MRRAAALALLCALPAAAADRPAELAADRQRQSDIQACAACHPKEYAAWKEGPHAYTKKGFDAHWAKTDDPNSDIPADMRAFLKTINPRDTCLPCHAPLATVYGKSLPVGWDGKSRIVERALTLKASDPILSSGVDCVTCHSDGQGRVVTRADYVRTPGLQPPPGFCDPIASKTFSHPVNCVTCHDTTVHSMTAEYNAGGGKTAPFLRCEECHWEKGAGGRYT
ncbi:MAG: multiheme c-type cytochrome, partial [Elusimicrobiota bacterium]